MAKPWRPKLISYESGSSRSCDIWNLEFKNENEKYYVKLLDGLLNNITSTNINEWVKIKENGFLILDVNSSANSVVSFSLEFSNTTPPPIEPLENVAVTNFKIFFARVIGYQALARYYKPIYVTPIVVMSNKIVPLQPSGNNVINFYSWKIE